MTLTPTHSTCLRPSKASTRCSRIRSTSTGWICARFLVAEFRTKTANHPADQICGNIARGLRQPMSAVVLIAGADLAHRDRDAGQRQRTAV